MMTSAQFVFLSPSILNPPLARALGVGLSEVMIYNSLMGVSGVVAMTFLAPALFRKIGVRAAVVVGGLWLAATMGAVAVVPNVAVLYVLGFAAGLSFGIATTMAGSMLVNTWFESSRGTVMGGVFAVSGLGGIGAGLALPALVSASGWQSGFLLIAVLQLVLVVLPGLFLVRSTPAEVGLRPFGARAESPESRTPQVLLPGVPARMAFRTRQFAALALAIVLFSSVLAVQQHFAPMMVERGVELPMAGTLLSLMALASVFSNIVLGMLNDRRGTLVAVLLALACQALSMVAYIFSAGFLPLAASTALFAMGAAFPGILVPIVVMLLFGMRDYPTILGPAIAMVPAGISIGTPLWGMAYDRTGSYTIALVAAAALTVVATALLSWTIRSASALRTRVERELNQTYDTTG
ncbi:MAG: MFS transporter [Propionicimonas sp.]